MFLKEGAASDFNYRLELARLLRYESTKSGPGELISLSDYAARMKEGQEAIYFLNGSSREMIEAGPYLEAFRSHDLEVIYTYEPVDDFVLSGLAEFEGKKLVSADQADLELPALENGAAGETLDSVTVNALTAWLKETLGDRVSEVRESKRLVDSPAIVLNLDGMMTSSMQRVMQSMNREMGTIPGKALEINPRHDLIKRLAALREKEPGFAGLVAEQILDNALMTAGLVVEPRVMVERINRILERALTDSEQGEPC